MPPEEAPTSKPPGTPPSAPGSPFAPSAAHAVFAPGAVYAPGAVPPPPIGPDGPGQVPYGYPVGYPQNPGVPGPLGYATSGYGWPGFQPPPSNSMGIASLVLGIVAAVGFCLWPLAFVLGVLAVIFGFVARAKVRRGESTNPGQALAGIICGAIGALIAVGISVLILLAPDNTGGDTDTDPYDDYDGYSTSLSRVLTDPDAAADPLSALRRP